jgi:predicted nuclease of predicted toxin-antitoxin system
VKLLFDYHLSPKLVRLLADVCPDSTCANSEWSGAQDAEVWQCAAEHGFTIVTKDADFHQRSLLLGAPPKVV